MTASGSLLWLLAPVLQGTVILVDEFICHRRRARERGLPLWERAGHPLDTLSLAACLFFPIFRAPSPGALELFAALGILSCLLITKDEAVHARECTAFEHWLHSILFLLHPVTVIGHGALWLAAEEPLLRARPEGFFAAELGLVLLFALYQAVYWGVLRRGAEGKVDNAFYGTLGERWYAADDDPVALLRAEARLRNPWVRDQLPAPRSRVLDLGCGAGFLSNYLSEQGNSVVGIDLSSGALEVARAHDESSRVEYRLGDATRLPFADGSFDAVCAMDLLEHVEDPAAVVREAARLLRPGGRFFFHTFDRNPLSALLVIGAVRLVLPGTPKDLHLYRLFVRPRELRRYCRKSGLAVRELRGVRPVVSGALLRLAARGRVPRDFRFRFSRTTMAGYCGYAEKTELSGSMTRRPPGAPGDTREGRTKPS